MRRIINDKIRTSVYNALVNSHLSYGISVWGNAASETKLQKLFVLQKKCLRNLFNIKKIDKHTKGHTKRIFNENGILTIHNLCNYFTLTCIANLRLTETPSYLFNLLQIDHAKQRIYVPILSTNHYQHNFLFHGPKLWNLLLPFIKDKSYNLPSTIEQFKTRYKKFLIRMQSDDSEDHWISSNFNVDKYLVKIKHDPYFIENMRNTALSSITTVLFTE